MFQAYPCIWTYFICLICLQIAEKKLIEHELLEEEKRLNDIMENERRWAIKEELRKEQEEAARRLQFANILKEQIVENEEQRILEFERKQEESRLINLHNIARQQDEIEKMRDKEAENARIRQELKEGYEQLKHFKDMEQEKDKIMDLRFFYQFLFLKALNVFNLFRREKIKNVFQHTKLSSTKDGKRGEKSRGTEDRKITKGTRKNQDGSANDASA